MGPEESHVQKVNKESCLGLRILPLLLSLFEQLQDAPPQKTPQTYLWTSATISVSERVVVGTPWHPFPKSPEHSPKHSLKHSPKGSSSNVRVGLAAGEIKQAFLDNLRCALGRLAATATVHDLYFALALTVRDRLFACSVECMQKYGGSDARRVAYLSAEFLLGPHLANNLLNLGITEAVREAMEGLGYDLDGILAQEEEPGLGNGGLGRLAACYMDSLASVEVPAVGYGIRYEFGIFDQIIRDGWQCEITDKWLRNGNPWEIARSEIA